MMVTICKQCRHFLNREPGSAREDVWYNHLCQATPLPTKIDPYDGQEKPYGQNDFGDEYFSPDRKFEFCRKVNDGNCPKFEAKHLRVVTLANDPSRTQSRS